jgi:hypothetical protein
MTSFCVSVIRGIKTPLLLVLEVTSRAAEAAGVVVPMPTWAKMLLRLSKLIAVKSNRNLSFFNICYF